MIMNGKPKRLVLYGTDYSRRKYHLYLVLSLGAMTIATASGNII